MIPAPVSETALQTLPDAIWIASKSGDLSIYRGTPLEIVRVMAAEMGDGVSIRSAVRQILAALSKSRGIRVQLVTKGLSDEVLARLFVYVLLNTGVGRVMARA